MRDLILFCILLIPTMAIIALMVWIVLKWPWFLIFPALGFIAAIIAAIRSRG